MQRVIYYSTELLMHYVELFGSNNTGKRKSFFPVFLVPTLTMSSSAVMPLPALAGLFLLALAEVKAHAAALTQVADMLGHLGHGRRLTVHAACLPTGHLHIVCPQWGQCCHLGPLWTTALLTVRG